MTLTAEQVMHLFQNKIGVTEGIGQGPAGSFGAMFATTPMLCLQCESVMPTDVEVELLKAFLEYHCKRFWSEEQWSMDIPRAVGVNTYVLLKQDTVPGRVAGGWYYRRATWSMGPMWIPHPIQEHNPAGAPVAPASLMQVLDYSQNSHLRVADGATYKDPWTVFKGERGLA